MQIRYDTEKLNEIIYDFYNITGLSITLMDSGYNNITDFLHFKQPFCRTIQERCINSCIESDSCILRRCAETKEAAIHTCHTGLLDAALPIILHDEVVGYIIMGQARSSDDFSSVSGNLPKELLSQLKEDFEKLPVCNYSQIESAIRIAAAVITKILSEKMIVIDTEELASLAAEYIDGHLKEELCLNKLCLYLNVSKNRLYKSFNKHFGCTVNAYVTKKRIEKACELLGETEKSIAEIAEVVGFSDYSYFFKVFKKATGKTPLAYRKESVI